MSKVDMSPAAVGARLEEQARLSDLHSEHRLATKVDMSPAAVGRRLELQSRLRRACLEWQKVGEANGLGRVRREDQ